MGGAKGNEGVSYYDDTLEDRKVLGGGCVSSGYRIPCEREPYRLYRIPGIPYPATYRGPKTGDRLVTAICVVPDSLLTG